MRVFQQPSLLCARFCARAARGCAAAFILYSVIAVPFRLAFRVADSPPLFWSDALIDLLFGVDIVATFRTAFVNEELVSTHRLRGPDDTVCPCSSLSLSLCTRANCLGPPLLQAGLETNPWKIATRYFGDFFMIDLFSTIPFDTLSEVQYCRRIVDTYCYGRLLPCRAPRNQTR